MNNIPLTFPRKSAEVPTSLQNFHKSPPDQKSTGHIYLKYLCVDPELVEQV